MRTVIKVENLSKKYTISHERTERYTALRDVIARRVKSTFQSKTAKEKAAGTEDFWALSDLSFDIKQGDRVGIIGRNGAGKSTLLKILSRITEPTRGRISIKGRVASLLEVGTGFHPELTGRENIFLNGTILGMNRVEIKDKFDEIVAFAEVERFLDTPVKRYSSGMYVRLAFAVAAHLEPEILIVDEVLAVGDAQFQKKCLGKMEDVSKTEGRTILFVSHNTGAIKNLCNKGIYLKKGQLALDGTVDEVLHTYLSEMMDISKSATFENPIIRKLSVEQKDDVLEINFSYACERPLKIPCFGFVISDELGNPVTGTNPIKSGIRDFGVPKTSGDFRVILTSPKLMDGIYFLSIWFGDENYHLFNYPQYLTFEISNMALNINRMRMAEGSIIPECIWEMN
jgi:lipopolysaccharide transport system ATP-binding protein